MRCKALVERNGYFTGVKCKREATFIVTNFESEDVRYLCTQHKNKMLKNGGWYGVQTGAVTIEEVTK